MKQSRSEKIIELIRENGFYMSVEKLSELLSVSKSTIRRNLQQLEKNGKVKRKYGGVEVVNESPNLPPFSLRKHKSISEKTIIARLGASLVKNGDVIFLDGSSTACFLTNALSEFDNLTIITNGLNNVQILSETTLTVYTTGGKLSPTTRVAYVGQKAVDFINSMHADIAFISALGIDENGVLYDMYDDEIAVRTAMLNNSTKKVIMLDSLKRNKIAPFKLGEINDFDYCVSDINLETFVKTKSNCTFLYD